MGASKSRKSRSTEIDRQRFGLSRRSATRPPLPVIVVVCDDARTAVAYFDIVKREVKEKLTLHVVKKPCDRTTPSDVIGFAIERYEGLRQTDSHDDQGDQEAVWALIDVEQAPERRRQAQEAKSAGEKAGVCVALSNPCYEVWTLLHLEDSGAYFSDCDAVLKRLEREWLDNFGQPLGKKAQADYTKIMPNRGIAVARAKQHHKAGDQSWTEVYQVIERINQVLTS